MNNALNLIGFYVGWFLAVYGASKDMYLLGPYFTLIFVPLTILLTSNRIWHEILLLIVVVLIGAGFESLLVHFGIISFLKPLQFYPLWMIGLWANFSTTLSRSLSWLGRSTRKGSAVKNTLFCAILGLVGGPLAYSAAHSLGVVLFPTSSQNALVIIALEWGAMMPILLHLKGMILKPQL
jgi:hypothetical protein